MLKFYLKNYISCGRKEKKKKNVGSICNGSGYAEKGTECQPSLRSREFRESFAKTIRQPHSFENLNPGPQKNWVSLSFCRILLRLLLSEKKCIYLLIMKEYGDKKFRDQETCDLFNATFNAREPISKLTVVRIFQRFITDSIKDCSRNGRPTSASNDEKSATILVKLYRNA